MTIPDRVREHCAAVAGSAKHVEIAIETVGLVSPGPEPVLDAEKHFLEGSREDVARYLVILDSINFGSGWFPTLKKRPGCSGYYTVAWALADWFRANGGWNNDELRALTPPEVEAVFGQEPGHPLMSLFTDALRSLGAWLGNREVTDVIGSSAVDLAESLAAGMPFFNDVGFWKRAQIVPNDLALAGIAEFDDLDQLTIFADNLVPHVLRVDGVLRYSERLAAKIDAGELLEQGSEEEVEIRASAVVACARIATELDVPERTLDTWLWNRGQDARYKAIPRHRSRTVFY
jgi:hypothetical protein